MKRNEAPSKIKFRFLERLILLNGFGLFSGKRRALNRGTVSAKFKRYAQLAGLPEVVHFHTLRHTFGTLMADGGAPIDYIGKILGHSSLSATQIYLHTLPARLRQSVLILDPMLSRVLARSGKENKPQSSPHSF